MHFNLRKLIILHRPLITFSYTCGVKPVILLADKKTKAKKLAGRKNVQLSFESVSVKICKNQSNQSTNQIEYFPHASKKTSQWNSALKI